MNEVHYIDRKSSTGKDRNGQHSLHMQVARAEQELTNPHSKTKNKGQTVQAFHKEPTPIPHLTPTPHPAEITENAQPDHLSNIKRQKKPQQVIDCEELRRLHLDLNTIKTT